MTTSARRQLIVFARAPQYGAVKTRLARQIGAGAAWRAYQGMTAAALREVADSPLWQARLAVTPPAFARRARFWSTRSVSEPQAQGDLGQRMAVALTTASVRGPAIIVGTDIPAMTRQHVRDAFDLLARHDVVFGPAMDGGFWLVGVRQGLPTTVLAHLFDGVRWSTASALEDTIRNVRHPRTLAYAATLRDVDDADDLALWRGRA
ncbi:MAG: glycosyltransferase [Alphaproteobacteria bacterium]|nr:glycosyltransferase [Alphaproteobacteria bacterium]